MEFLTPDNPLISVFKVKYISLHCKEFTSLYLKLISFFKVKSINLHCMEFTSLYFKLILLKAAISSYIHAQNAIRHDYDFCGIRYIIDYLYDSNRMFKSSDYMAKEKYLIHLAFNTQMFTPSGLVVQIDPAPGSTSSWAPLPL